MSFFYHDANTAEMAPRVAERLSMYVFDRPEFHRLVEAGLKFVGDQFIEKRLQVLDAGWISPPVFHALMCGGEPYSPGPVKFFWDCLERAQVFVNSSGDMMPNSIITHQVDGVKLLLLVTTRTMLNIFSPPSSLSQRYSKSLLAVDVLKAGSAHRGSGFLLRTKEGSFVVTCKHNIDPSEGITDVVVSDLDELKLDIGTPLLHAELDLACIPVDLTGDQPVFFAGGKAAMFDEVYTLGFPMVPGGSSTLVGHRGEVNGHTDLYLAKSPALLISNLVSPGSSGCPVLTREGFCVGMTMRWVEAESEQGGARFSCALPASSITEFLRSRFTSATS